MIARAGSGWQTVLADLSMILFIVTAAVVSVPDKPSRKATPRVAVSQQSEPLAYYADEPDAPPLAQWLAAQGVDERQQLTITAHYARGDQATVLARAGYLAREAGEAGARARIVLEPGRGGITAVLAYDVPQTGREAKLAQDLLDTAQTPQDRQDK